MDASKHPKKRHRRFPGSPLRIESAPRTRLGQTTEGHVFATGLALLLTRFRGKQVSSIANLIARTTTTWSAMNFPPGHPIYRTNSPSGRARGGATTSRRRTADRDLHLLIRELIAARVRAGLTQGQVASKMGTTKSAISRLENTTDHRPRLATIENYALVVGCRAEIRLRSLP